MKVVVFGATGRTGLLVVEEALQAGFEVRAFTRSAHKLPPTKPKLVVIVGELTDEVAIDQAVAGSEAVISVLGPSSNKAEMAISAGMARIIAAMKRHGIKRLIMTAGAGIGDAEDKPTAMSRVMYALIKTAAKNVYLDMAQAGQLVRESGLEWTIVRAPRLTERPKSGRAKVAWVGKGMGAQVSRADLAQFVVEQVADLTYVRRAPALSD